MTSNKNCIGISWGCDTGVVSVAALPDEQQQAATTATADDLFRPPTVLANADGNRATNLWLNVANDEFLSGDGAKNATLRFPQQAVHSIVRLLDGTAAASTLGSLLPAASAKAGAAVDSDSIKCPCGCPCRLRGMACEHKGNLAGLTASPDHSIAVQAVDSSNNEDDGSSSSSDKPSFAAFLKAAHNNGSSAYKLDGAGLVVKTRSGGDEDEAVLPATNWDCGLAVLRLFRTIIRDALSGGGGAATTSSSSTASSDAPASVIIAVPRAQGTVNRSVVADIARVAWKDWTTAVGNNSNGSCNISVVYEDIAALAAVLPKSHFAPPPPSSVAASNDNTNNSLALVVNWGATSLTVSLFAVFQSSSLTTLLATRTLDRDIGGFYIDQLIVKELLVVAQRKKFPPIGAGSRGYRKFLTAAERTKLILSSSTTTSIEIESAVEGMDFVEPSFTRSKLDMVLSSAGRLPAKFQELLSAVFADVMGDRKKRAVVESLGSSSSSAAASFGIVLSGGTLRIPSLNATVRSTASAQLQQFIAGVASSTSSTSNGATVVQPQEVKQAAWSEAATSGNTTTIDPQEIISIGACVIAQTGTVIKNSSGVSGFAVAEPKPVPAFVSVSSASNLDDIDDDDGGNDNSNSPSSPPAVAKSTTDTAAQAGILSCDVGLLSSNSNGSFTVVLPCGVRLPVRRNVRVANSPAEAAALSVVVKKTQSVVSSDDAAKRVPQTVRLTFPVTAATAVPDSLELAVDANGELTVSNGDETLLRVQL